MTTTIDLADEILLGVRRHARRSGLGFSESVQALLRKGLSQTESEPVAALPLALEFHPETGLPCFGSPPDAPAWGMTVEDILALEQAALE